MDSSADYDASPKLDAITASVLAINAADDERNPPQSGIMDAAMKRVKNGQLLLIPESDQTLGPSDDGLREILCERSWQAWLAAVPERKTVGVR